MSWVDAILEDWGAWKRAQGEAQGWGGASEWEPVGSRDPNTHSDPVGAEHSATSHGEETGRRRVDRYIELTGPTLALTARLRFAGAWLPTEHPEYKDRPRWIVSRGTLEGCGEVEVEMAGEVWFRESPQLAASHIAVLMGCAAQTVRERLDRVREAVRRELQQDARAKRATRRKAA
jgi:hypothetical protein